MAAKQKKSFDECATFTLEIQGREASATLQDTKATTDADTTMASLGKVKVEGQTVKTLSVYGFDGNNAVAVILTAPKDVDAAVDEGRENHQRRTEAHRRQVDRRIRGCGPGRAPLHGAAPAASANVRWKQCPRHHRVQPRPHHRNLLPPAGNEFEARAACQVDSGGQKVLCLSTNRAHPTMLWSGDGPRKWKVSVVLKLSTLFLRTLREDPVDAEVASHRLLVRAGYIRRAAPGIYTWLPLGLRC